MDCFSNDVVINDFDTVSEQESNVLLKTNNPDPLWVKESEIPDPLWVKESQMPDPLWVKESEIPDPLWVNILIPCYNTNPIFIKDCLASITAQVGNYGFEMIWINDGSTEENTRETLILLKNFVKTRKHTTLIYKHMGKNSGIVDCLNMGLSLCKHDLIFRMDSDDVMAADRIDKQVKYMTENRDCMICGTNIAPFVQPNMNDPHIYFQQPSSHKELFTWTEFLSLREKPSWFMNHPTLCFRKQAVDEVGLYSEKYKYSAMEDYELELRFLKKYGAIHNLTEYLLYYRIHANQVTILTRDMNKDKIRNAIIRDVMSS
jgi:glycosyltransferase involved in cell wall biosynthesis